MLFVRCYYYFFFFFYWVLLLYNVLNVCSVTNANQQNRNNNNHTNRIESNKSIITRRKRSLQSTLTLTTKLTASNGGINNRIVVGAWGYNNSQGAAYFFMDPNDPSAGRSYSQMEILTASDRVSSSDFGDSVDIDGDIIVVGAGEDVSGGPGAVYIFRIGENDNISQMAKITAQNGSTGDWFGYSVAIHGKFILVGAPYVDVNGLYSVGSAYLFANRSNDPNNQEWTQIMQFQPNDLIYNNQFGNSVAMDDQFAVVGTYDYDANADAAYVFVPVDDNVDSLSLWTQMAKLTGPTGSNFGYSVAVAGNSIVVGAFNYEKNNGNNAGAVFVYTKIDGSSSSSVSSWTQTNILLAGDGADGDNFGYSVSISKDASTIVMGAYWDDYNATFYDSGAVYLFRNSLSNTTTTTTTTTTTGWTQVGKFVAADRDSYDYLGSAIAIENSIVVVGAYGDESVTGAVYILDTENSPPPPTTAPIVTTTAPTVEPVIPTLQPTASSTTKPTNSPTTKNSPTTIAPSPNNGNGGNNPSLLPTATSTPTTKVPTLSAPTPPENNNTSTPRDPITTKSDNNNVLIAAIGGASLVILGIGLGIAFFNYRLKRDRLRLLEQQEQQNQIMPPSLPPAFSGNNGMAAVNTDEMPVMANVFVLPPMQLTEDRTLEANVLLDPSLAHAATDGNMDVIDAENGLPRYKDQTRQTGPPRSSRFPPPPEPIRNSQTSRVHPRHSQERRAELPVNQEAQRPNQQQQQQQLRLRDPPAFANLHQGHQSSYKDQVSGGYR